MGEKKNTFTLSFNRCHVSKAKYYCNFDRYGVHSAKNTKQTDFQRKQTHEMHSSKNTFQRRCVIVKNKMAKGDVEKKSIVVNVYVKALVLIPSALSDQIIYFSLSPIYIPPYIILAAWYLQHSFSPSPISFTISNRSKSVLMFTTRTTITSVSIEDIKCGFQKESNNQQLVA